MFMMDLEIPLVVYLAKKDEYICPPKDLYTNVSNSHLPKTGNRPNVYQLPNG